MYIVPLNLPKVPDELYDDCVKFIKDVGVDRRLDFLNSYRQIMNKGAPISQAADKWIRENIFHPYFTQEQIVQSEITRPYNNIINVTTYLNDGTHPIHIDVGRNYALNYYFDTGGSNTRIRWYAENKEDLLYESDVIVPNQWYLLFVRPIPHSVVGIEPGRDRIFLTLNVFTEKLKDFNEEEFFKKLISC